MRARVARLGAALALAASTSVVSIVTAVPAGASPDPLQVSADGAAWADALPAPLFDPEVLWVPGDARTASFFVANRGPSPAAVGIGIRVADDTLVGPGDVVVQARAGTGPWHRVGPVAADDLNAVAIGVRSSTRLDVRARFLGSAGNTSQSSGVTLSFAVDLHEAVAETPGRDDLPGTGAAELRWPLLVGAVLTGAGLVLVRRRGQEHGDG